jgi:hypothetical protein
MKWKGRTGTRGHLKASGCMRETPLRSSNNALEECVSDKELSRRCTDRTIRPPKNGQMPEGGVMPTPRRGDETVDSAPAFGRNGPPA